MSQNYPFHHSSVKSMSLIGYFPLIRRPLRLTLIKKNSADFDVDVFKRQVYKSYY